ERAARTAGPDGERSADAPPLLTGGESGSGEENVKLVLSDSGKVLLVPKRRGWGGKTAFVDWLNFTVHETTAHLFGSGTLVTDHEIVLSFSEKLEKIFGYGITCANSSGRNFYKKSYELGEKFGLLCHGGQRNTVLVMVSGDGLAAAKPGWEKRLHDFLTLQAIQPRLTRLDLAHDDYDGSTYSVDQAKQEFELGRFNNGGRMPDCEQRGNWYKPNGKGRTFYVGHRVNGKYARIYEKGKQLGDGDSLWCRIEVEFKAVDRVIPFDALLRPGEYLAASYPAFGWLEANQQRIKTIQKSTEISYASMCAWLVKQCGSALAVVAEIEGGAAQAFEKVGKFKKIPSRLNVPHWANSPEPLHRRLSMRLSEDVILANAFA
ncbi:MAG: replication initiation factor domain-containing protein, partial [Methylovulum sp.]|nr:replication initiation factor domain-containing protein [Methylovulum sp.]